MKRKNSLKDKKQFNSLIKNGKKKFNKHLSIYWEKSEFTLVGISIPKKIANSVNRNKNKRILKNILDEITFFDKHNLNIIFIARKDFLIQSYKNKKEIVENILKNIK